MLVGVGVGVGVGVRVESSRCVGRCRSWCRGRSQLEQDLGFISLSLKYIEEWRLMFSNCVESGSLGGVWVECGSSMGSDIW